MDQNKKYYDNNPNRTIAYFSMEVGLRSNIPTYSGGLGILAGDTLKSAADMGVPLVAVTLLNEKGYFYQKLDQSGNQTEEPANWPVNDFMEKLDNIVTVNIQGREVKVGSWLHIIKGVKNHVIPVLFLTTNVEGNSDYDKSLTSHLYGGDRFYRLCQEVILGIGGVRMLESVGYNNIRRYHMNEGHAALLTLELRKKHNGDRDKVKSLCVFTTHTPVPAGHDKFEIDMARDVLREMLPDDPDTCLCDSKLNMTHLALMHSHYVNGVAQKHKEVSQSMFPNYAIHSITNGVHSSTWICNEIAELLDKFIPDWRLDPTLLRYAGNIPKMDVWTAHRQAKKQLMNYINQHTNTGMDVDIFTIGFARRATEYKRPNMLLWDKQKLRELASKHGKFQIVFSGKAHPNDGGGKDIIRSIFNDSNELRDQINVAYLENYNMEISLLMTSGVDIWLNTPRRPREASGTSGMKASHNGVPHFSVLDGWWMEGHIEDITGWAIGPHPNDQPESDDQVDSKDLYLKLDKILGQYKDREKWIDIMRNAIAYNASFFNTHRMVQQYWTNAYSD